MKTIFVGNLPNDTSQVEVRELFSPFGDPQSIKLNLGGGAREHHGTALVELDDAAGEKVIAGLDGQLFKGAILSLSEASDLQVAAVTASGTAAPPSPPAGEEPPSSLQRHHYEVASVERTSPPSGAEGEEWHRYVLSSGRSSITGLHRGSSAEVWEYAESCAAAFNQRSTKGKTTRGIVLGKKK
jgi:RNA recognition motif-containing protein